MRANSVQQALQQGLVPPPFSKNSRRKSSYYGPQLSLLEFHFQLAPPPDTYSLWTMHSQRRLVRLVARVQEKGPRRLLAIPVIPLLWLDEPGCNGSHGLLEPMGCDTSHVPKRLDRTPKLKHSLRNRSRQKKIYWALGWGDMISKSNGWSRTKNVRPTIIHPIPF